MNTPLTTDIEKYLGQLVNTPGIIILRAFSAKPQRTTLSTAEQW